MVACDDPIILYMNRLNSKITVLGVSIHLILATKYKNLRVIKPAMLRNGYNSLQCTISISINNNSLAIYLGCMPTILEPDSTINNPLMAYIDPFEVNMSIYVK
jgi:hypothetical protein